MKRIIILFVAIASTCVACFASSASDSLSKANDLYAKKKYADALVIYKALNKSNYQSATLLFNTGNAYYKTNDFVNAILFYERALLLDPNNEDIKFNLEVARTNQVDKLAVIPEFFLTSWFTVAAGILSSNSWAILSLVLFTGALVLAYLFLFSQSVVQKRSLFSAIILVLLLSGTTLYVSSFQDKRLTQKKAAILMTASVTAKSSPDDAGTDLFVIHEGLKVTMIDKVSGWVKIKLSNGSVGWLKMTDVEVI